jgi:hypothetical protein
VTRPSPGQRTIRDQTDAEPAHPDHLIGLLADCAHFLRTASPDVHNELRAYLTARGHHPTTALPAFLDQLQFTALRTGHDC